MDITHSASTKALGQDVEKINMAEKASKDPEYAKAINAVRPDILKGWADDRTKALVASTERVEKIYGEKLRNYENLTANILQDGKPGKIIRFQPRILTSKAQARSNAKAGSKAQATGRKPPKNPGRVVCDARLVR